MKTFLLPSSENEELTEQQLIDLSVENYAIATNNVDKIAIGGANKQVQIYTVAFEEANGQSIIKFVDDPYLAMVFNSAVRQIEFFGANQIMAISDDSTAKVVDIESGKMTDYSCG